MPVQGRRAKRRTPQCSIVVLLHPRARALHAHVTRAQLTTFCHYPALRWEIRASTCPSWTQTPALATSTPALARGRRSSPSSPVCSYDRGRPERSAVRLARARRRCVTCDNVGRNVGLACASRRVHQKSLGVARIVRCHVDPPNPRWAWAGAARDSAYGRRRAAYAKARGGGRSPVSKSLTRPTGDMQRTFELCHILSLANAQTGG